MKLIQLFDFLDLTLFIGKRQLLDTVFEYQMKILPGMVQEGKGR